MTYSEFVSRPSEIRRRIAHDAEEVAFLEEACMKSTSTFGERVQTSPANYTEIRYTRFIDAQNKLDKLFSDLLEAQEELREFLYGNLNVDLADTLEWKYINDKEVSEIAKIKGIAYQTAKNKLNKAEREARNAYYKMQD